MRRQIPAWVAILITLLGAALGFSYRYATLEARVTEIQSIYVRQDVLMPQLEQIQRDLTEIKADVKTLMREAR